MATTERQPFLPWVIIAILGVMLLQSKSQTPSPEPKNPSISQVVKKMMDETSKGYAKEFERVAADVGNGIIKNEEQLHKTLKEGLDNVRSLASDDLNRLMDASIPTEWGDGDRGSVSTFLRSIGSGFK